MGLKGMWCHWIRLAQDSNQWRVLVNTVMNLRVSWKVSNFLTSWVIVSLRRCCSIQ
jgi:hypothetical protein